MDPKRDSNSTRGSISRTVFVESHVLGNNPRYPRISVVTPSFNQAEFLTRTILSVLNQDYPNLEYIVMDGGSRDGSLEIIRGYERQISYWSSEKDAGQSDGINKGFLKSTGEILAWLNSDDTYLPGTLKKIAAFFVAHPTVDVLYGDAYIMDEKDSVVRDMKEVRFSKGALRSWQMNLIQPSTFWRRDMFFAAGMLRPQFHFAMDVDLWFRFLNAGAAFAHIPEFLSNFRLHPASKSVSQGGAFPQEFELARVEAFGTPPGALAAHALRWGHTLRRYVLFLLQGDMAYANDGACQRVRAVIAGRGTKEKSDG
jgi:glycosyltransferase involved in cell wall biosynthesis